MLPVRYSLKVALFFPWNRSAKSKYPDDRSSAVTMAATRKRVVLKLQASIDKAESMF
jgi:hypothetical protein